MQYRTINSNAHLLLVEDDPDDIRQILKIFRRNKIAVDIDIVTNGEEALAYVRQEGRFIESTRPDLILLDLNLPKIDGFDMLAVIKADDSLKTIPVVVLTTSRANQDILRSYQLNANSYHIKPLGIEELSKLINMINEYWLNRVKLPPNT